LFLSAGYPCNVLEKYFACGEDKRYEPMKKCTSEDGSVVWYCFSQVLVNQKVNRCKEPKSGEIGQKVCRNLSTVALCKYKKAVCSETEGDCELSQNITVIQVKFQSVSGIDCVKFPPFN
jgi:hypothetical protein